MEEGKYYGKQLLELISNYGVDETLTIVIEECLELGKCITKYKREKNSKNLEYHRDRIIEEIADVVICIEMLFGIKEEELRIETEVKMQRNLERIK